MIKLSKTLGSYLCDKYFILDKDRCEFDEDELDRVKEISISKNNIDELKYFKNLDTLDIDLFPSISEGDLNRIAMLCPNIERLKIKEQNALFHIDISNFNNLKELYVGHNDNLVDLRGVRKLQKFVFYDNKEYIDSKQIVDYILNNRDSEFKIDIVYYVHIVRILSEMEEDLSILDNIKWVEAIGLRNFKIVEYSIDEVKELFATITDIVSKYTYVTDGKTEKYGVLYQWMLDYVRFVNEDEPKGENVKNFDNVNKVFSYLMAGRLTYAKAFQLLLGVADVDAKIVYSMGADDSIGYYDGKKVYSLLGNSDYALLRINLNGMNYYADIAWDSLVDDFIFADSMRMFLVSKDELKIRQKFVGEGNIEKSYSYHGDDSDDLLMFAKDRIKDVNKMFGEFDNSVAVLIGAQLNTSYTKREIADMKEKLKQYKEDTNEYKEIAFSIKQQEELLKDYLDEEHKLSVDKDKVINKYRKELISKYVGEVEDINMELDKKLVTYKISRYLYDMLKVAESK